AGRQRGLPAAGRDRRCARPRGVVNRQRMLRLGGPCGREEFGGAREHLGQRARRDSSGSFLRADGRGSPRATPRRVERRPASGRGNLVLCRGRRSGKFDAKKKAALEAWAEVNNYENKLRTAGKLWGRRFRAM